MTQISLNRTSWVAAVTVSFGRQSDAGRPVPNARFAANTGH